MRNLMLFSIAVTAMAGALPGVRVVQDVYNNCSPSSAGNGCVSNQRVAFLATLDGAAYMRRSVVKDGATVVTSGGIKFQAGVVKTFEHMAGSKSTVATSRDELPFEMGTAGPHCAAHPKARSESGVTYLGNEKVLGFAAVKLDRAITTKDPDKQGSHMLEWRIPSLGCLLVRSVHFNGSSPHPFQLTITLDIQRVDLNSEPMWTAVEGLKEVSPLTLAHASFVRSRVIGNKLTPDEAEAAYKDAAGKGAFVAVEKLEERWNKK